MSEEKSKGMVKIVDGDMIAETPEGVLKIANMHLRSGMLPKHYNTIEKVVSGMTLAREYGLKPLAALRQIAVINGTPSLYGDLPLSLAMKSDDFEYIREYYIDEESEEISPANKNVRAKIFGAVCVTKRRGAPHEHVTWFTLDDKQRAKLNSPVWNSYERIMLKYRARSANLKDNFPDCINGIAIAEYDNAVLPEVEGLVIESVSHNGERTRMQEIRDKFIESEAKHAGEVDREEQMVNTPEPELTNGNGNGATKKPRKRKAKKPANEVGDEQPTLEYSEVSEVRPVN